MKKIYFLLFFGIGIGCLSAQNPDLYRIWDLKSIEYDFGGEIIISEVEPEIAPYILFNTDNSFQGFAACTAFEGDAEITITSGDSYGDITFTNLNFPEIDCEHDNLNLIQEDFRFMLSEPRGWLIALNPHTQELELLIGETFHTYRFIAGEMSTVENSISEIKIYPNPATDYLFVENVKVNSAFQIFDIGGNLIQNGKTDSNSSIIVSPLEKGTYVLKINGQSMKFLKK